MKKILLIIILFLGILITQANATIPRYPDPNRQTIWNDFTDKIHTMGQNPLQARKTRMRLHYQRTLTRLNDIHQAGYLHRPR